MLCENGEAASPSSTGPVAGGTTSKPTGHLGMLLTGSPVIEGMDAVCRAGIVPDEVVGKTYE